VWVSKRSSEVVCASPKASRTIPSAAGPQLEPWERSPSFCVRNGTASRLVAAMGICGSGEERACVELDIQAAATAISTSMTRIDRSGVTNQLLRGRGADSTDSKISTQFDTLRAGVVQSRNSRVEKRRRGIVRAKAASREPAGGASRRRERAELAPELRERTSAEAQVARVGVAAVSTAESGRAGHAATSSGVVPREKGSRPGRDESFFDLGPSPRPLRVRGSN